MPDPIIFVDVSEVVPGKLDEVKTRFKELASFVEENEPRPISYNIFFDPTETLVTVVQIHPDSASMEFHVEVGAEIFRRFADLLTMRTMAVYGEASAALLAAMQAKATMLGAGSVEVHGLHAGFMRFA